MQLLQVMLRVSYSAEELWMIDRYFWLIHEVHTRMDLKVYIVFRWNHVTLVSNGDKLNSLRNTLESLR